MKKSIRYILLPLLTLCVILFLLWGAAHLFTGASQFARTVAWLDSDIEDYKRFPSRILQNQEPVFNFHEPSQEQREQYRTALAEITYGGKKQPLDTFLKNTDSVAFLVIKDDRLLYEGYFNGYNHDSTVTSFSTAKSFVSALVGIAISEGAIGSVEDPITRYVPELLAKDPRYANIKIRHLISMSSGIRYEEHSLPWSDDATTYYAPDLRAAAISSPILGEPGKVFHYNNFHPLLIGLVLERTAGMHVAEYLQEKIWKPLGMEAPGSWSLDHPDGFEKMESGINGRAIDFAKFGRLFLRRGDWNGVQLIPASWVDSSTALDTTTDPAANYQYFWWVNSNLTGRHHFFAAGKHGQYIYIIPEQDLVMVRFGRTDPLHGDWQSVFETLALQIAQAGK